MAHRADVVDLADKVNAAFLSWSTPAMCRRDGSVWRASRRAMKLLEVRARLSKRLQDPVVAFRRRDDDRRPSIAIGLVRVCSFREHAPYLSLAAYLTSIA